MQFLTSVMAAPTRWLRPGTPQRMTVMATGLTFVLLAVAASLVERQLSQLHFERQRTTLQTTIHPYHEALQQAIARRLDALPAMRAFLESGPPGPRWRDDLDAFAEGLHSSIEGIRALQYVHGGIIRYTSHPAENRAAAGYNLLADPREMIRQDVLRALSSNTVVLSGPIDLLQGGRGLVARLATFPRDDPRFGLVAVVMDIGPLFVEAGLADPDDSLLKAVRDREGTVLFGPPEVFARDPVTIAVNLPDRSWTIGAVPAHGWHAVTSADWSVRGALVIIVALGTVIAALISSRQAQLQAAVGARTRELTASNTELATRMEEIRTAEAALREQHQLLRAVVEGSPDLVLVKDAASRYVLVNQAAARAIGKPVGEIVGRTPDDLYEPEFAADVRTTDQQVLETGAPVARERRLKTADGERTYIVALHPWLAPSGDVSGTVTVARDVTERLLLETQLRHAQKLDALGRLSGGIAHDFNNLLTAIMANAHLLAESLQDAAPALLADAEAIQTAAHRGAELTRKLLAFGRRDLLERKATDLTALLDDNGTMLRRLVPERIDFMVELPDEALVVRADQGALAQVLLNLVANARDALTEHGRITVSLTRVTRGNRAAARLAVADTGVGMDERTQAHVFEPFFTTKPPGQGTGLGLSIVYGLVQRHDGTIEITSAPRRGTTVTIELPLIADPAASDAPPAARAARGRAEHILVVEDEDAIRESLRRLLVRHGYRVDVAIDGQEGLDILLRAPTIALVVSDMVMPRMSGVQLCRTARAHGVRTPFLFTTGYTGGMGPDRGTPLDGELLPKPWLPQDLLARVRSMLDRVASTV